MSYAFYKTTLIVKKENEWKLQVHWEETTVTETANMNWTPSRDKKRALLVRDRFLHPGRLVKARMKVLDKRKLKARFFPSGPLRCQEMGTHTGAATEYWYSWKCPKLWSLAPPESESLWGLINMQNGRSYPRPTEQESTGCMLEVPFYVYVGHREGVRLEQRDSSPAFCLSYWGNILLFPIVYELELLLSSYSLQERIQLRMELT